MPPRSMRAIGPTRAAWPWAFNGALARLGVVLVSSMMSLGCVVALVGGTAAAVGGIAYVRGELNAPIQVPIDRVWEGTVAAIEQLGFPISEQRKDGVSAVLEASTATERAISIRLERVDDYLTAVRIRVGVFGDESLSRYILEQIESQITETPPASVEPDASEPSLER